ncbi:hypothetical protein EF912_02375 [Streptomyces sp. WAC07061]|uniref:hypothetical protein n=1 Tax=Streptomyces sp. WAC07061 TaxID=2487410 RepID=UPI000F7959DB|nr:hypothetical protein [Streptomyces sp. WAC07061]RSS64117.1 hypothetical protein EF912_02375 [Streptomyces sp. WAC07061]
MAIDRPREPVLLDPKGPVITAIACTVGAVLFLGAAGAFVYVTVRTVTDLARSDGGWVWAGAGLALAAAFVAYGGISTILFARAERRATVELAAHGVDATALVLAVTSAPPSNDDHDQIRLLIRIDGPGFEPFEHSGEVLRYLFGSARQGTVLPARVDVTTRTFTIEPPPTPPTPQAGNG